MGALVAVLTEPEVQALLLALGAYADAVDDGPGAPRRTRAQKMADCLMDLVLRPGESGSPPVQVVLTLVASLSTVLGGDEPAELGGRTVSAETARQLLRALTGFAPAMGEAPTDAGADTAPAPEEVLRQLADWWDDVEQRVFAGGLDPGPQPLPEPIAGALAGELGAELCPDVPPGDDVEEDLAALEALLLPGEHLEVEQLPGPCADDPPGATLSADAGAWTAADRAVQDAGRAVREATLALGRARQAVGTAECSDADDQHVWRSGAAGRVDAAGDALQALQAATGEVREQLADLLARTRGGGLADRPRIALVDALSGALVSLTDLPGLRRPARCGRPRCRRDAPACDHDLNGRPGLGPPLPTDGYRPSAALDRFVRARDRRCRFPGCRRLVATGEIDHRIRYPEGPTAVWNLAGLCTGDHRGKHQAPGFSTEILAGGSLVVVTPTGLRAATDPPPY